MKNYYNVKNLVTGYVFNLPKEDCDRLYLEEPYNFKIMDDDYVPPIAEEKVTTVYEQIIEEEEVANSNQTERPFENYSYDELKAYCKTFGLGASGKKEELLVKVLKHDSELKELYKEAEEKGIEINQYPMTVDELKKLLEDKKVEE